ncbi:MAG: hypothetical protein ACRD3C_19120 [Vicinamibacterales bacterium]
MDVVDVGTGLGILVRGPDFTLVYDGGSNDDLARGPSNRMLAYLGGPSRPWRTQCTSAAWRTPARLASAAVLAYTHGCNTFLSTAAHRRT